MTSLAPNTALILQERLKNQPDLLLDFSSRLVEDILTQPLEHWFEPKKAIQTFVQELNTLSEHDEFLRWFHSQLEKSVHLSVPNQNLPPLRDALPPDALSLLKDILGRPRPLSPELVRIFVDQPAVRNILQTVLKKTLTDFGRKISQVLPDTSRIPGSRLRSKLLGVAKDMASAVSSEIEKQTDERITLFLQDTMGHIIDLIVDKICDPESTQDAALFRQDILDSFVDLPPHHFFDPKHDIDPDQMMEDTRRFLQAFAQWEPLEQTLYSWLSPWIHTFIKNDLLFFLQTTESENFVRKYIQEIIHRQVESFFSTQSFAQWLDILCQP